MTKKDLTSEHVNSLLDIVRESRELSTLARSPDRSSEFWHYMESNYIFTEAQIKPIIKWALTPIAIND